jgi:hypothetical protein
VTGVAVAPPTRLADSCTLVQVPNVRIGLAEALGWMPNWLERLDHVYSTNPWRWSENSFGDQLPSDVWKGRVLACFIEDRAGLRLRDVIGVENLAW